MSGWAVKVTWENGEEEFLKLGMTTRVARFPSRSSAKEQADFMAEGFDEGEVQAIAVVPFPREPEEGAGE